MIISRTPFRISLFGGSSDYPRWYREHGGSVLGFAINKVPVISRYDGYHRSFLIDTALSIRWSRL